MQDFFKSDNTTATMPPNFQRPLLKQSSLIKMWKNEISCNLSKNQSISNFNDRG